MQQTAGMHRIAFDISAWCARFKRCITAHIDCSLLRVMRRTANLFSRQGLQKWWPQGVDIGSFRISLHSEQVNSRSARSCSEACTSRLRCQGLAAGMQT